MERIAGCGGETASREGGALGEEELGAENVGGGYGFCYGVFDLQAGVYFEENVGSRCGV
jgi:hypothetical protein